MSKAKLVIIGGVAAGMSAASRARRLDPELEIEVFEASGHVSYGSCGLPYLIGRLIARHEDLVVYTPEFFRTRRNIRVHLHHRRSGPRRRLHTAHPGGRNCHPRLHEAAAAPQGRHRGAGYIGMEMAEAFRARGLHVTVVEMLPQVMSTLDPEVAALAAEELKKNGVALHTGAAVDALDGHGGYVRQVLTRGLNLEADLVLLAGGVRPSTALASSAGIELGPTGGIAVTERMETSRPSIWAAGDVAEALHRVTGKPAYIPLGTTSPMLRPLPRSGTRF